jgi:CRISPR-associated protein Cmr2
MMADGRLGLTASCGVVISHHNFPIYFLREKAEELLKSAKKYYKEKNKEKNNSCIDFLVMHSTGTAVLDLHDYIGERYIPHFKLDTLKLTERPYTIDRVKILIDTIKKMKNAKFPLSQFYQIRTALEKGRPFSRNFYYYQLSRLEERYRKILDEFEKRWWGESYEYTPWSKTKEGYSTPFIDLLEIYDFIREGVEIED